jgi:hypothetical protein
MDKIAALVSDSLVFNMAYEIDAKNLALTYPCNLNYTAYSLWVIDRKFLPI